jgi:hypothetical protein
MVVCGADRHPTFGYVPGGAHSRTLQRRVKSDLDFRQLAYLFDARFERQAQRGGQ